MIYDEAKIQKLTPSEFTAMSTNTPKKALITGITGQDGSYLAELLLEKGYEVHGLTRRVSSPTTARIDHIKDRLHLHMGEMSDVTNLVHVLKKVRPDELYNLAAMSQVRISYDIPAYTGMVTGFGFANLIEAVRIVCPEVKLYQACSSEMFGKVQETPQTEKTPFYPRSPYGCAKAYAFHLGRSYREGYGLQVYNGILFNHESPRRGEEFLSKKVVQAAARIKMGRQNGLTLGNLDSKRDWGYAKEYVEWIWRIVQHPTPEDFVICTGETHSVEEFVAETFSILGLNWKDHVSYDKDLTRAAEVDYLQGDYTKSKNVLGFEPQVKFKQLVNIMVDYELQLEQSKSS
jgi:GDPmannose 4,6-dehydratase